MEEQKKVKATEKLAALEDMALKTARRLGELEMIMFNNSRTSDMLTDAISLMNSKLDATISLISEGKPLTDEAIEQKIIDLKVQSMEDEVEKHVKNGRLELTGDGIDEETFVQGRELDKEGKVQNPLIQFFVGNLLPELMEKFVGKKAGDLVEGEENGLNIEILKVYKIVNNTEEDQVEVGKEETQA